MPQNPSFQPSYLLAAPLPARIYGQSRLPIPHMSPPHESPGPGGEETRRCPPHPACSSRQPSNGTPHADAAFTSALPPPRLLAPAHLAHLRDTPPGGPAPPQPRIQPLRWICEAQGEARAGGSEECVDFDAHGRYRGTTSRQCLAAWLAGGGGGVDGHRARVKE